MVFYRFNHLSQSLKAGSTGCLAVSLPKSVTGAPRYVYKPLLAAPRTTTELAALQSSDHGGHHDPGHYISKKFDGWEKWKSWKDVPDHLIPRTSWRDPDNPVYAHPQFVKMRKQQLFMQRPCDLPIYLRNGDRDRYLYAVIVVLVATCFLINMKMHYENIYKKYYPDSNLFYFF